MSNSPVKTDVSGDAEGACREILRAAVEGCAGGMFVANRNGTIIVANPELGRLFGYRQEELVGRPVEVFLPESSRRQYAAHRGADTKQPVARPPETRHEFIGRRRDGGEVAVEIGLASIRVAGEPLVVGTVVDVSERKRLDRIRDEFVATLSHELRTPITSIGAALGLLLADPDNTLSQSAVHLIEIAHANCQRLIRMTSDVLDLHKIEAGQMSFRYEKTDAHALLENAIEANRALADDHKVGIRLDASKTPIALYVDPDRFMQVMTNLLSNAIKFSPPGEEVVVTTKARADRIHITVRDRGPGIPAEFRHRVFETFAQFDGDIARKKGGTGLGLSIAHRIVTCMHGQIGFDDAPGGGAIFHVDLPEADFFQRWQQECETHEPGAARTPR